MKWSVPMPIRRFITHLHIRLEQHEKDAVDQAAKRTNKSASEWVRSALSAPA